MTGDRADATAEYLIGPSGQFQLRHPSGDITIRGTDGDRVRVTEESGRPIPDLYQVEVTDGSVSLTARSRFGLDAVVPGLGRASHDLAVEVPRGAAVVIETASGEIEGTDLQGSTRIRTASGEVDLRGLAGVVDVEAVSADVTLIAAGDLDLRARTISGDLAVRAPRLGRAEIGTTSGDVRLDAILAGVGPYDIQTVSGDVTIVGRSGLQIDARTVTGDLASDLPHRNETGPGHKRLIVGDGATHLGFKSVSGDLRVVAPRESGAESTAPERTDRTSREGSGASAPDAAAGAARLDLLRALERGEMSVEVAMERLAEIGGA